MNTKTAFVAIGKELNIARYEKESLNQYHARIAYSAVGMWLRMFAAIGTDENIGLSKTKLHRRISNIINNFSQIEPSLAEWFYPDESSNPENLMRDTLLRAGDLIECDFDSTICCGTRKQIAVEERVILLKGNILVTDVETTSGLAVIVSEKSFPNKAELFEEFDIPVTNPKQLIELSTKNNKWCKLDSIDNYEIFDHSRNKVFSACWLKFLPLKESQIYIARRQYSYGVYEYQYIKQEAEIYYVSSFSEYEQDEHIRCTQRLLYAFKAVFGEKAKAVIKKGKLYSTFHFWSKLPPAEESFLRYIGWPLTDIENRKNEFVIRNEFFDVTVELINNLGMEMELCTNE